MMQNDILNNWRENFASNDIAAHGAVGFDQVVFLGRQRTGLAENVGGDIQFSNVMDTRAQFQIL
jgi:hypothetical protein